MNQTKSQDILAKLLATENITIIRGNVRTASFDIKDRILTLPRWRDMTQSIEEMLMLHEVGHALFTGMKEFSDVMTKKSYLKDYVNVIEDVRIEKKMKDRYPGSRKSFNAGYKELNERQFFIPKEQNLEKLLLIDRINIFFKVGYSSNVKFTSKEYDIIQRVDKCDTEEDVIKLAEDIYEFSEDEKEEELLGKSSTPSQEEAVDESDEDDDDENESDSPDQQPSNSSPKKNAPTPQQKQEIKDSLKSKTVERVAVNLDSKVDELSDYKYYDLKFEHECNDTIVPYKTVTNEMTRLISPEFLTTNHQAFLNFKADSAPIVNYLIKEFEMRKSATAYKRAKVSRLGQLDPRKLYAYKIKEDLFKQITTIQNGKKHGMIFLLDWSGSMRDYIDETIKQVINLAMFCQRTQIPYQVFAFTDGYDSNDRYAHYGKPQNPAGVDTQNRFNLLELFCHKMTSGEFNRQMELLLSRPYTRGNYRLNGTPLNTSLLYMVDYIGKFKRNFQVEKLSLITLTDGESNALNATDTIKDGMTYVQRDTGLVRVNRKSFFHDHVTKKDYPLTDAACQQTATLLEVIRDRYDANSIGFFICESNGNTVGSFIRHNMNHVPGAISMKTRLIESLKKDKYAIMKNVPGRDELYLIASNNVIREFEIGDVNDSMSSSQISNVLTKAMNKQKHSRIILNSFIGKIA